MEKVIYNVINRNDKLWLQTIRIKDASIIREEVITDLATDGG